MRIVALASLVGGAVISLTIASLGEPVFKVAPSKVAPPPGVALGDFRRSFQPFENWTLICDEDLRLEMRICNIRQDIEIEGAGVIFSWAMAATDDGKERMVVNALGAIGEGGEIVLIFDDGTTYSARVQCTANACVTTVPVGPHIRRHIEQQLESRSVFPHHLSERYSSRLQ